MKRRGIDRPSAEELASIEVTDEDERDYVRHMNDVARALQRARIPGTIDWCAVCIGWVAQVYAVKGMGLDFWLGFIETCNEVWQDQKVEGVPAFDGMPKGTDIYPRMMRLKGALERAKLDPVGDDACFALVSLCAKQFARVGVPPTVFHELGRMAFLDAEKRIADMAQKKGGKA